MRYSDSRLSNFSLGGRLAAVCATVTIGFLIAIAGYAAGRSSREHFPPRVVPAQFVNAAEIMREKYISDKVNTHLRAGFYGSDGDYLKYGKYVSQTDSERLKHDENGVPMGLVTVDGGAKEWQYVPVTVANAALMRHGQFLRGQGTVKQFLAVANKLRDLMDADGALRSHHPFVHYSQKQPLKAGWVSGMNQGLALSVFYRAYQLTEDQGYLDAGKKAFEFMQVKFPDGPMNDLGDLDPSLKNYIWFDEFLTDKNVYTLNGYMFAVLGLYDWSHVDPKARVIFDQSIISLKKLLPYFDIERFSAYDLSYITNPLPKGPHFGLAYHGVHIAQLKALYSVTGETMLSEYADMWLGYVNGSGTFH